MASRKEFEERVYQEVLRVLLVGESVRVSGYAMTRPGKLKGELTAIGVLKRVRHYWIVVTDQRVLFVSMGQGPINRGAEIERAEPFANLKVIEAKRSFRGVLVRLAVGDDEYVLSFTGQYKEVGQMLQDVALTA